MLKLIVGGLAATIPAIAAAQSSADAFEQFRSELLGKQENFRSELLKNYADFLEGAWEEFETFKTQPRNATPKPDVAPKAPEQKNAPKILPAPTPAPEAEPVNTPAPKLNRKPGNVYGHPGRGCDNGDEEATVSIDFHGINIDAPSPAVSISGNPASGTDFANLWRAYMATPNAGKMADGLEKAAEYMQLNDYLTFDLIRQYVGQSYPSASSAGRISLCHFLLANMGYDARIALSGREGLLLIPVNQTLYSRPYMVMGSQKYYVFSESDDFSTAKMITTCRLPEDATIGKAFDMHFTRMPKLPAKPKQFSIEANGLTLTGEVNENLFPLIYRYPQTDMEVYASSEIDAALRKSLVEQVKTQLADLPALTAVNTLLRFTQDAIAYATDEDNHGFEKPYFLEEWLYYPRNDCEDRAVFYTYMLWNALGVECQMVTYPGHESAAVRLPEPIEGDNYVSGSATFYISDPTFIGAKTGQCMPNYVDIAPKIEFHYK